MESTILRKEVIEEILSGEPFDMEFLTCDRRRGTGGELITVEGWLKVSHAEDSADGERSPGITVERIKKDPHHWQHGTVNIYNPANAGTHPITVHCDLITFFNGKRVIN